MVVDFFVKWQINDVATFYRATGGGRLTAASNRLEDIMKDGLRNEFSRRTIEEALSDQRDEIMQGLEDKSNEAANQLGINIVDVRVSKIDFPEQVSESVYERMRSERMRVAQDFRSRGREEAEKIKAAADRQVITVMAEAYRDSEKIRGEGDAKSAETYANAYQADADFYAFYRSLDAYRKTLGKQGDMMVLEPDSEFFRFFKHQDSQPSSSNSMPVAPSAPRALGAPLSGSPSASLQ
ncbi:MAG: protease modulator HflC [Thiolinea sp.]